MTPIFQGKFLSVRQLRVLHDLVPFDDDLLA